MAGADDIGQATYWERRYQEGTDVWDLEAPAPGLLTWLAEQPDRHGRGIVLGSGPGHDAVALARHGLAIVAVDFAPSAVAETTDLAAREGVALEVVEADLFALPRAFDGAFDFVFEHTFFCTLEPACRPAYRDLVARLLRPGGELVGVFFTFEDDGEGGPPFPIRPDDLEVLLAPAFACIDLAPVANSVERRQGDEHLGVFRRRAAEG